MPAIVGLMIDCDVKYESNIVDKTNVYMMVDGVMVPISGQEYEEEMECPYE